MNWYVEVLKKYAVFEGRAHREEYWMFVLINFVISFVLALVEGLARFAPDARLSVSGLYALAVLVPGLAVSVRRLHDTGKSGWYLLIGLIPFGAIAVLVWLIQDGNMGPNMYGPDPKSRMAPAYGAYGVPTPYAPPAPYPYAVPAPPAPPAPYPPAMPAPPAPPAPPVPPAPLAPPVASTPAGWLADPMCRHELRYWDGRAWTGHVSDSGVTSVDPV